MLLVFFKEQSCTIFSKNLHCCYLLNITSYFILNNFIRRSYLSFNILCIHLNLHIFWKIQKSNQIKSNQIKSNQLKYFVVIMTGYVELQHAQRSVGYFTNEWWYLWSDHKYAIIIWDLPLLWLWYTKVINMVTLVKWQNYWNGFKNILPRA